MGFLVAIEGIDGSGKGTQAALLAERARNAALEVATFSFPRYGEGAFSALIADYLNGELGDVRPELPALLYAGDRLSARHELLDALERHDLVVLDRYVASNLAHQGANAEPERRAEVLDWIAELEYGLYALPKPDLTVLLDLPVARAREQVRRKSPRGYTQLAEDVLEAADAHLEAAADIYRELSADPAWAAVDAAREPREVAAEIWRLVEARR